MAGKRFLVFHFDHYGYSVVVNHWNLWFMPFPFSKTKRFLTVLVDLSDGLNLE